jgi:hypothetical protein
MLQQINKPVMFAWARCHHHSVNKDGVARFGATAIAAFMVVWLYGYGDIFHWSGKNGLVFPLPMNIGKVAPLFFLGFCV